jgi:hypothetical protein
VWHDILHVFGVDTQQSYWYDFWSGIATQASLVFLGVGLYRRNNCRKRWCWRIGRFHLSDNTQTGVTHALCWRHHPGVGEKHSHLERLLHPPQ